MDHIRFNDHASGELIAEAVKTFYNPRAHITIARVKDDRLLGGVIFYDFTHESIWMHCAAFDEHWGNRDMIYAAFDYPFNQLRVKRIFGKVPEDNWHAQVFNTKFGFRRVARIEGVFRHGIAAVVMCMERAECRFLGKIKPRTIKSNQLQ